MNNTIQPLPNGDFEVLHDNVPSVQEDAPASEGDREGGAGPAAQAPRPLSQPLLRAVFQILLEARIEALSTSMKEVR